MQTKQGCIDSQAGRGLERSVSGQIIGSGLYKQGDIWSGSLTLSSSSSVNGHALFLYNHTQINNAWMMDTTMQLSTYKDQFGGKTTQFMPMLRGSYRFRERFNFDADCGYQNVKYEGPNMINKTTRLFMSSGLRWDF
jgi:hypothetical protein